MKVIQSDYGHAGMDMVDDRKFNAPKFEEVLYGGRGLREIDNIELIKMFLTNL